MKTRQLLSIGIAALTASVAFAQPAPQQAPAQQAAPQMPLPAEAVTPAVDAYVSREAEHRIREANMHMGSLFDVVKLEKKIEDAIAKSKINGSTTLLNQSLFRGANAALRYKYMSEPSYAGGYFSRGDTWTLNLDLSPLTWISSLALPIGFSMNNGTEIQFIRQFPSQQEALLALPYTPANLPLSADRALNGLKTGDFVSFTGRMNFVLSASQVPFAMAGPVPLTLAVSEYVSLAGNFTVHVFRMPGSRVRVKFIAEDSKGVGGAVNLSATPLSLFTFHLRDVENAAGVELGMNDKLRNPVDKAIDSELRRDIGRIIDFNPVSLSASRSTQDVFLIDYIFDLADKDAAAAYDGIMGARLKLKESLNLVSVGGDMQEMKGRVFQDLVTAERLFQDDKTKPVNERRIDRVFDASTSTRNHDENFKLGLSVLQVNAGKSLSRTNIQSTDRDGTVRRFALDTISQRTSASALWGVQEISETTRLESLFSTTENFARNGILNLIWTSERTQKSFNDDELDYLLRMLRFNMTTAMAKQAKWTGWARDKSPYKNMHALTRMSLNQKGIRLIGALPAEKIAAMFKLWAGKQDLPSVHHYFLDYDGIALNPGDFSNGPVQNGCGIYVECYSKDIDLIAKKIATILDEDHVLPTVRFQAFIDLQEIPLFKAIGVGFFESLFPAPLRGRFVRVDIQVTADDMPANGFHDPVNPDDMAYESVTYVEGVLGNRSFDMRVYFDEKGVPRLAPPSADGTKLDTGK